MELDPETGWLVGVRHCPSPNCDRRPEGCTVDLLVVHGISLPPGEFGGPYIDHLFTNSLNVAAHPGFAGLAGLRVSAHLLIRRDGTLTQYVSLDERAWHAGVSCYMDRERCNDYSIGIELEGADGIPYDERQYEALIGVTRLLLRRWPAITPERIVGHSDIAPGRKTDPGPAFDWRRFRDGLLRLG
jgi:AmpD protein